MRQETATAIRRAAESEDLSCSCRHDYSGRGMFGKTTWAVEVDGPTDFIVAVALAASEFEPGSVEAADFCADLGNVREDQMGLGLIFY